MTSALPFLVILLWFTKPLPPNFSSILIEHTSPKTVLLLAHKWESKTLLLDLDVDGSFEGRLASGAEFYGLWEMKSDRKTLFLYNDPLDEEEFQYQYEVIEVSFDKLRLRKPSGKAIALYLVE